MILVILSILLLIPSLCFADPVSIAVIATSAFATAAGASTGLAAAFVLGVTVVATLATRAFAKKPRIPSFSVEVTARGQVIRSSIETRKIIYGTAKISGPLIFAETTNTGPRSEPPVEAAHKMPPDYLNQYQLHKAASPILLHH